jgi:cephalosporin hydroxylase
MRTFDELWITSEIIESGFRKAEMRLYHKCLTKTKAEQVCEIGVYAGRSTLMPALMRCRVLSIDPFDFRDGNYRLTEEEAEIQFMARMKSVAMFRHTHIKAKSCDAWLRLAQMHRRFDTVLVDGAHDYDNVACDTGYFELVRPNGFILFHRTDLPEVRRAVTEYLSDRPDYKTDRMWVFRRRGTEDETF